MSKEGHGRKENFKQDLFCIFDGNIYYLLCQINEVMACKMSSTGSSSGDSDSGSTCCQRGIRPDVCTSVCNTSNLSQDPTVQQQDEDNCGILDRQDAVEFIFSAGDIVVFR